MRSLIELPWDKNWAVGGRTAFKIAEHLNETKPKLILDIGSGLSTVLFAEWAGDNSAEVVSLEHKEFYYHKTQQQLKDYGVKADLRLCRLIETRYGIFYETDLPDDIDFALIDGPPGYIGREATLYNIYPHLSKNFTVWLDDSTRPEEQRILQRWQTDLGVNVKQLNDLARATIIT